MMPAFAGLTDSQHTATGTEDLHPQHLTKQGIGNCFLAFFAS